MGLVYASLDVRANGEPWEPVEFLIDTGAAYTCLPWAVWRRLGLRAMRSADFHLIDGSLITRKVSECRFRYQDIETWSPVILGGRHDVAVLGVVTLESLGLVVHPYERRISPGRYPLKACLEAVARGG
jgi:predicted aspartyl protease